ncbi:response regulator [Agriterribacter sp.]|uniref:response regulator n=1 Tax=Agriterribacter sp. TaxID=2821509 RepID=UPI002C1B94BA|nr:response regulator [Agriterribacter sp.]HRO46288.1 response regulator [Agriterribacter sp.]HRQ18529.1 response regulator [Agriterribacter sp.]
MPTVLVIDDNADIRDNTAEILELAGYTSLTAGNGKKGVETALREKPDIIICDIMMPELDGYGVLHLLQKNADTRNIPFIFLTAKTERSDLRKGMEMGADDYITKPFEEIELLNAVEVRLKKREILSQKYEQGASGITQFMKDVNDSGLIQKLTNQYDVIPYNKKQFLYQEGKRARFLYYIVKGKVKGFRTHEDGKEYITDLFSEGDFIGYAPIIEDRNYEDSAIILEEADILQLPREDFQKMIYNDLSVAAKFIHLITQNVKEKEERLLNLAYSSLRKRIAKALVDIHNKFNAGGPSKRIEISREDIAQYVGTATESLIRTLSDFKSEKLIEIKEGKIIVSHPDQLSNLLY